MAGSTRAHVPPSVAKALAAQLGGRVTHLLEGRGRIVHHEEDITAALVGVLSGSYESGAYVLEVGVSDKYRDERRTGFDLFMVLAVTRPGMRDLKKGLIAQMKNRPRRELPQRERLRLQKQCEAMIRKSPRGSYVGVIDQDISLAPAPEVVSHAGALANFQGEDFTSFLEDFFLCHVGTQDLGAQLDRDPTLARHGLDMWLRQR